jgi:hypothetical protein
MPKKHVWSQVLSLVALFMCTCLTSIIPARQSKVKPGVDRMQSPRRLPLDGAVGVPYNVRSVSKLQA